MSVRHSRGFTLIELLVVVAIIGLVSTIAIPTLLNAIDRGKQKRTMATIRNLGRAIEEYAVDYNVYPVSGDIDDLGTVLEGEYMRSMIKSDGWDNPLLYNAAAGGILYTLGSPGKDGGAALTLIGGGGPTHGIDDDIIYSNGTFLQWPEGAQE